MTDGLITLSNGDSRATVAMRGAEVRAWSVGGQALIWAPDTAYWSETAPLLFPVVGWTRGSKVRVGEKTYPLGLHGFARTLPFRFGERGADFVRLVLESSPDTKALYPFDFKLDVTHRIAGSGLRTVLAVRNRGDAPMPYACGLHPGFRWPFVGGAQDDYAVIFAREERTRVPVISADGLFTRETRPVPLEARRLALSPALMANEALCFLDARSQALRFAHAGGGAITMELDGFPHIALWSRPEARFLAIEAWTGRGDDADGDGDLMTKPSMIHLAPGAVGHHAAAFGFKPRF